MKNRLTKRNTNFSPSDIKLLLTLVDERKSIINSKRTDRINSQVKEDCWQAIQKAFNAESNVTRTSRELKKKYENFKSMAKKKQMSEECSLLGHLANTRSINKMIIPNDGVIKSQPDSNLELNETINDFSSVNTYKDLTTNTDTEDTDSNFNKNNYINSRLCKRRTTKTVNDIQDINMKGILECASFWAKYANAKSKLCESKAQAEIKLLQEEHNLKMRHLEERHRMEMEKTTIELEILKANLELKHRELGVYIDPITHNEQSIKTCLD